MTTATRWWAAPNGKTELDAVEKAMLAPTGENKSYDLGGVLLAAHRAGAGACRKAAVTPLLDERGLINALAETRQALGIPMAEAVAKCIGEGAQALLLTRDLLDDADEAALDLFRAAVAKGVPAPTAALRVGDIYGADTRSLGKYRTLALDPKANPIALTDTADRVLFAYIQEICNNELSEPPVFSKATIAAEPQPGSVLTDEREQREYVRDDEGRFATVGGQGAVARMRQRMGIGATSIPRVSDVRPSEQEQQAPAGPTAREVLAVRQLRRKRAQTRRARAQARESAELAEAETSVATPETSVPAQARTAAPTRTRARTRTGLISAPLRAKLEADQQLLNAPSRVKVPPKPAVTAPAQLRAFQPEHPAARAALSNNPYDVGVNTKLQGIPDDYAFAKIPGKVQLVLGDTEAKWLLTASLNTPERIFRLNALTKHGGVEPIISPEDPLDEEEGTDQQVWDAMDRVARKNKDIYTSNLITPTVLARSHPEFDDVERKKDETVNEYLSEEGWGPHRNGFVERKAQVNMLPAADGDGWYLVDWKDTPFEDLPMAYVFTIPRGAAEGDKEGTSAGGKRPEWSLNPNQSLKTAVNLRDISLNEWTAKGYYVNEVDLEPVDQDHWKDLTNRLRLGPDEAQNLLAMFNQNEPPQEPQSKALDTAERTQLVTAEPRDDTGRWVPKSAVTALRERLAAGADQQQVAAVRALRAKRRTARTARRLRQATAIPVETTGDIAIQEQALASARTSARTRTRARTRAVSQKMAAALDNPARIKAQEKVNSALKVDLQRQRTKPQKGDLEWHGPRLRAVPKAVLQRGEHKTVVRHEFTFDEHSNHVIMTADDFEDLVREAPGRDQYRVALDSELGEAFAGMASGDDVVPTHIKAAHHVDYTAEGTPLDREDLVEFAGTEAQIREQMRGILTNTGASVVEARNLRAHDKNVDLPANTWQLSYDQHSPRDPVYAIRVPEDQLHMTGEYAELHRMLGPPQYVNEHDFGSLREGYLRERSIPVVTYELTAPSEFVETFDPRAENPEWGQSEVERQRRQTPKEGWDETEVQSRRGRLEPEAGE